ncbi:MAG TPA: hypothetical protein VIW47_11250 [Nitrospiraceae bacterium]|jgi:hypothetical protein
MTDANVNLLVIGVGVLVGGYILFNIACEAVGEFWEWLCSWVRWGIGLWKRRRHRIEEAAALLDKQAKEAEEVSRKKEEEAQEKAKNNTPRQMLEDFYSENAEALAVDYPPPRFAAFLELEMGPGTDTAKRWEVCHRKIGAWLPLIAAKKQELEKLEGKKKQDARRLVAIQLEIQELQDKAQEMIESSLPSVITKAQALKYQEVIRKLEREREGLRS